VNTTNPASEPTGIDVAAHVAEIAVQGFTVVPDAVEPELLDAVDDDLRRIERDEGVLPAGNDFEGAHTIRIYNLLARGELYGRIPVHPNVLPVVEGVLDAGCLVSSLSSIGIDPGERAQPIHADDQLIPLAKPHAPTVCNTMWALTDFTEENGATRLVPRSHLLDHSPHYGGTYDTVPAEMARGSVLVWHGSLWHGGGANRSSDRRVGVAMNYCAGFIRQQENQQLGIPTEVARTFSPRLRELCGFGIYSGLIGHIDKRSPSEVVLGEQTTTDAIVWDA
jgi:ectoine hydroxylase-related dioxygenase (phytanoyl-CoA dioxygenase family)